FCIARGDQVTAILGHVRDVRAGGCWRSDGASAARTDGKRLPNRQCTRRDPRVDAAGANVRTCARPCAEWTDATVLRLGLRPYRSREHDVHRLPVGSARYLWVALLRA